MYVKRAFGVVGVGAHRARRLSERWAPAEQAMKTWILWPFSSGARVESQPVVEHSDFLCVELDSALKAFKTLLSSSKCFCDRYLF